MIFDRLIKFFTSLKLTVVLLALGIVLIFFGTLGQEPFGLYTAQERYFRSFFVDAGSVFAALHKLADMIVQGFGYSLTPLDVHKLLSAPRIPVFPGGYLLGGLLIINLFAAHFRYYKSSWKKMGIAMIHIGIVLLLVGQFLTDFLAVESSMHIRVGGVSNFSENDMHYELAVVDTTDAKVDKVIAIPSQLLKKQDDISYPALPFTIRVKTYYGNSSLSTTNDSESTYQSVNTSNGAGADLWWRSLPHVTKMTDRDIPSGIIELITPQGPLGTFLVSGLLSHPQEITLDGHTYEINLRPERFYKPFYIRLLEFQHDLYPGTDIPKNFSSRVRLQRPETGEDREVLIYMNNPLRYWGETYYQASFDLDDQGTVLQVVHNPSWLTPYFACVLVAAGLLVQFLTHLIGFAMKRKTA